MTDKRYMKPLTIEELKVGEWVWVVDIESPKHGSGYWQVHGFSKTHIHLNQGPEIWVAPKALYGKTWLAYKNKEQAETKGEWVELPRIEPFSTCNIETGEPCTCYNILYRDKASGELIIDCEVDKSEAQALLDELRGER